MSRNQCPGIGRFNPCLHLGLAATHCGVYPIFDTHSQTTSEPRPLKHGSGSTIFVPGFDCDSNGIMGTLVAQPAILSLLELFGWFSGWISVFLTHSKSSQYFQDFCGHATRAFRIES